MIKVSAARILDRFIGVPVCFICSLWSTMDRISNIFHGKDQKAIKSKKILFLQFTEMGNVILAQPAIWQIKQIFPEAEFYFMILAKNKDIIETLQIINEKNIMTVRHDNLFVFVADIIRNLRRINKEKINIVIDMELFSRFSTVLTYLTGAKIRIGFSSYVGANIYRGSIYTEKVVFDSCQHMAVNFMALFKPLCDSTKPLPSFSEMPDIISKLSVNIKNQIKERPNFRQRLQKETDALTKESKIIILNPASNHFLSLRNWPVENYVKLSEMFLADTNNFIVVIGLAEDVDFINENIINKLSNERCLNWAGKTSFVDLMDLLNSSDILISHDSGSVHFASLTDINIVALFGPETPALYAPLSNKMTVFYEKLVCSPCLTVQNYKQSRCVDNKCLQSISVENVYSAASKYLKCSLELEHRSL